MTKAAIIVGITKNFKAEIANKMSIKPTTNYLINSASDSPAYYPDPKPSSTRSA